MYYRLSDRHLLRGWPKLPYAAVDAETGEAAFLDRDAFEAASYATGTIDFDLPLISDDVRGAAALLSEAGIIHELGPDEPTGIRPEQRYRLYEGRYVRSVHWSITGKCNYRCKHCYLSAPHAKLGELSLDECLAIVDDMERCGVFEVSLTGGEPLVRKDFLQIVDALLAKGIRISQIYSNGKLVTPELLDALEARGIRPEFNMSFDGVGWHDWMRGVEGAEAEVERAFKLCQDRGFPTGSEMAIHEGSKGTLRESIRRLGDWGCRSLKTNPVEPVGEWESNRLGRPIDQEEMYRVYLDCIQTYFEDDLPLPLLDLGGFFTVDRSRPEAYMAGIDRQCADPASQVCCGSARLHAYIGPDGTLLPCIPLGGNDEVAKRFPNVVELGLAKAMEDPVYRGAVDCRVRALLDANPECLECEYLSRCAGGCRAHAVSADPTSWTGKDPIACDFYRNGWYERVVEAAEKALEGYRARHGETELRK